MAVTAASVAIPGIPPGTDPGLRKFLEAVKEAVEVRTNQRGSALDSSPTFQDLIDAGLISLRDGVTIGGQALSASQLLGLITTTVPDWVTSDTAPPAPVGLTVTPNTANTVLSWTLSTFDQYGSTEIWRASSNNLSAAVLVGSAMFRSTGCLVRSMQFRERRQRPALVLLQVSPMVSTESM